MAELRKRTPVSTAPVFVVDAVRAAVPQFLPPVNGVGLLAGFL